MACQNCWELEVETLLNALNNWSNLSMNLAVSEASGGKCPSVKRVEMPDATVWLITW